MDLASNWTALLCKRMDRFEMTHKFVNPYLPTPPPARAGYDTKSIFNRSLTSLNSDFSFSWTSCFTKAEETSLLYYLPIAGGRIISQGYLWYVKWNQPRPGFELVSPCPFPTTIAIATQEPTGNSSINK